MEEKSKIVKKKLHKIVDEDLNENDTHQDDEETDFHCISYRQSPLYVESQKYIEHLIVTSSSSTSLSRYGTKSLSFSKSGESRSSKIRISMPRTSVISMTGWISQPDASQSISQYASVSTRSASGRDNYPEDHNDSMDDIVPMTDNPGRLSKRFSNTMKESGADTVDIPVTPRMEAIIDDTDVNDVKKGYVAIPTENDVHDIQEDKVNTVSDQPQPEDITTMDTEIMVITNSRSPPSFQLQCKVLFTRFWLANWRNPLYNLTTKMILNLILSFLCATCYLNYEITKPSDIIFFVLIL